MSESERKLNESRYLRPGTGIVEHIEIDWNPQCHDENGLPEKALPLRHWWQRVQYALSMIRRPIAYPEDAGPLLTRVGLRDINHKVVQIPLIPNSQTDERESNLKSWYTAAMDPDCQGIEGLCMSLFTRQLNDSPEYVRSVCNLVRNLRQIETLDLYYNMYVANDSR